MLLPAPFLLLYAIRPQLYVVLGDAGVHRVWKANLGGLQFHGGNFITHALETLVTLLFWGHPHPSK